MTASTSRSGSTTTLSTARASVTLWARVKAVMILSNENQPPARRRSPSRDRKSTRLNSSHSQISYAVSLDRKSTRLNSSHSQISYAVFCLKKKNVPAGDAERRPDRAHCRGVHEERPQEDRGPDAVTEEQRRREGDARRRPHGRRARVDEGERQPELPGGDVDAGEDQEPPRLEGNARRVHLESSREGAPCRAQATRGRRKRVSLSRPIYKGTTRDYLGLAGVVPGYCLVFQSAETLARARIWLTAAAERPGVARVRFLTVLPVDSANSNLNLALEQV